MVVEIIAFIGGIVYGFLNPGKENKTALLKKGLLIGFIIAVIIASLIVISGVESYVLFFGSTVSIILSVLYLTVIFIVGTLVGDWVEAKVKT